MSPGLQFHARTRHLVAAIALALAAGGALADDYADVSRLLRAGQSAEALARANQYLAGKPRDPQMRFLKGVALGDAGRSAEALEVLTRLVEEYPELPEPHNNLAVLHAARGDLDKARTELEAALRLNPSYATAHENLGDIYLGLAARAWERAQQLEPGLARSVAPKLAAARSLAR